MYLQSIKSDKHNAANSVNRSILKKSRLTCIGFGVFIVHSSMTPTVGFLAHEMNATGGSLPYMIVHYVRVLYNVLYVSCKFKKAKVSLLWMRSIGLGG